MAPPRRSFPVLTLMEVLCDESPPPPLRGGPPPFNKGGKGTGAALGKIRPLAPLVKGGRAMPQAWRGDSLKGSTEL